MRALLGVLVFLVTVAECWVATEESRAENAYRRWPARTFWATRAAHWSTAFECVLLVWIVIGIEDTWLLLWALPGAWVGKRSALWWWNRRRLHRIAAAKETTEEDEDDS